MLTLQQIYLWEKVDQICLINQSKKIITNNNYDTIIAVQQLRYNNYGTTIAVQQLRYTNYDTTIVI